jgi:hypothetical protein
LFLHSYKSSIIVLSGEPDHSKLFGTYLKGFLVFGFIFINRLREKREGNITRTDSITPTFSLEKQVMISSGLVISIKRRRTSYEKERASY